MKLFDETQEEHAFRLRKARLQLVGVDISNEDKNNASQQIEYPLRNDNSKEVLRAFGENEEGDAYLMIKLTNGRYVYDQSESQWYYWNDHYWRQDEKSETPRRISEVANLYGKELITEQATLEAAEKFADKDQMQKSKALIKSFKQRISDLRGVRRQQNILKMAREGKDSLCITGREWDSNPWLLGCKNGTIDLEKGVFRPGLQSDYIRSISPVKWEGIDAPCPLWEQFMFDIMCRDMADIDGLEKVEFLQMFLGYSMTGLSSEHIYPIFYGEHGRNGKSTLFEILKKVLGILAHKAPSKFLMKSKFDKTTSHDTDMTELRGKRLVWCSESNKGDYIDSAKIKELTGGDSITARAAYAKKPITFTPTHTISIITNHKMKIPPTDEALWNRIVLIDFKYRFVKNPKPGTHEKQIDQFLRDKLIKDELPGILAWLVQGCLKWQRSGMSLKVPDSIRHDTLRYRKEEDLIEQFIDDCCLRGCSKDFRSKPAGLFDVYREWCFEDGHHAQARNTFYQNLDVKLGERNKSCGSWYYQNILIRDNWRDER